MTRYSKQCIFLGIDRDSALRRAKVAVVGLGATGSVIASWLARAGVGHLTLIDRDLVELTNLQRQILYSEADIGTPKATAAVNILQRANSEIEVVPLIADLTSGNAQDVLAGYDLIMDGTDNFEARYLINDISIARQIPWIYCGAIGSEAMVWPIVLPQTPCLRCLMEQPPPAGDIDTCDSTGVLGPAVGVAASWSALEAIKILSGEEPATHLVRFDLWKNERQFISPPASRCKYCINKITEFLDDKWVVKASTLCGLDGVQIRINPPGNLDLEQFRNRLQARTGTDWKATPHTLTGTEGQLAITIFKDGRALIHGDITPERARSWYTEVVGC
ncbi:MAG: ThiF family adenylyltransferase [Holophagaceae bacterium]|nr:ThiF family adenylyltransferase [Holophagaceae bacterium]